MAEQWEYIHLPGSDYRYRTDGGNLIVERRYGSFRETADGWNKVKPFGSDSHPFHLVRIIAEERDAKRGIQHGTT